jgi:biotin carboxylase
MDVPEPVAPVASGSTGGRLAELYAATSRPRARAYRPNVPFLRKLLASEEFRAGAYDTKFAEMLAKRP